MKSGREKAFKPLQILEREESRKRECKREIIKMKENAGLERVQVWSCHPLTTKIVTVEKEDNNDK